MTTESETFNEKLRQNKALLDSIQLGYLTQADYDTDNYLIYQNKYFNAEIYCVDLYGTIREKESCFQCDDCSEFFYKRENFNCQNYNDETICSSCAEDKYLGRTRNGTYYTQTQAEENDLVQVEESEYLHNVDDVYFWESDARYHLEYEEPEQDYSEYRFSYQSCSRQAHSNALEKKYRFGFEIEKADNAVLTSIIKQEFRRQVDGLWCKEFDGSLPEDAGFELVSPCFGFNDTDDIDKLIEEIKSNETLLEHINAKTSKQCGGHIHISQRNFDTSYDLFETLKSWTYFTYALYPKRAQNSYCQAMRPSELKQRSKESTKYLAWKISNSTIELRICSAVRNIDHLKARMYMINAIMQSPDLTPIGCYYLVKNGNSTVWNKWKDLAFSNREEAFEAMLQRWEDVLIQYGQFDITNTLNLNTTTNLTGKVN
jgi:hypothetical protein